MYCEGGCRSPVAGEEVEEEGAAAAAAEEEEEEGRETCSYT